MSPDLSAIRSDVLAGQRLGIGGHGRGETVLQASAVSSWPIEASARNGTACISGGILSRFRSCPALTTSPAAAARAAVLGDLRQDGRVRAVAERRRIATGVKLYPVGTNRLHPLDHCGIRIDEQDHPG